MKFNMNKEYQTKSGFGVTLVCVDGTQKGFLIIGYVEGYQKPKTLEGSNDNS